MSVGVKNKVRCTDEMLGDTNVPLGYAAEPRLAKCFAKASQIDFGFVMSSPST